MKDCMDIGPTPPAEDCAQLGEPGYYEKAQEEGKRYIALIRKKLGKEPEGAHLRLVGHNHDFGTYYEVACYYDDQNEEAMHYAYRCESDGPQTWDDDK